MSKIDSDEDIVRLVKAGDTESFGELMQRYEAKMVRYAGRFLFGYEDIKDLVQEVFIKAYRNLHSFDTSKRFSPWLYRIAHNEFINAIKKKGKEPVPFFDFDTVFPHPIAPEVSDRGAREREAREIVEGYLEKIGPKYREPLVLYYFEELSYKEIAEVLRIPVATVGVRIKRAKDILKKI